MKDMLALIAAETPDDDQHEGVSHLILTVGPVRDIPLHRMGLLDLAGHRGDAESPAPLFLAKPPDRNPREITSQEARTVQYVLEGIGRAFERDLLHPVPVTSRSDLLLLTVEGDPADPDVSARIVSPADEDVFEAAAIAAAPAELRDLPRVEGRWLVGFPVLPAVIDDDDRLFARAADWFPVVLTVAVLIWFGTLGWLIYERIFMRRPRAIRDGAKTHAYRR